ncbi:MAG: DUF3693 domain-containing protein [Xylella fastidiosa subsp. multiplex]
MLCPSGGRTTATPLLIGAGITCPNPSQAQSIYENSAMKIQIMHIMSIRWALIKRDV